jgi:hypothetical protein
MLDRVQLLVGQRQKRESSRAVQGCNDYLRLGPNRSLSILARSYSEVSKNIPTKSIGTLKKWCLLYGWQQRAEAYDARLEDQKNQRVKEIMNTGFALIHERVQTLKELEGLLLEQLREEGKDGVLHNLWVPDVKQIGSGEFAERVDIEHYNSPLISDIRGVLDDLAKETGGRVLKTDSTIKDERIVVTLKRDD